MIPVVIPIYGKPEQVERCVRHLQAQTLPVEIFLRDNNTDNIFFTAAINEGLRRYLNSEAYYIIILNQDMYLAPNAVAEMVSFMDRQTQCGIGAPLEEVVHGPEGHVLAGGLEAFPFGVHRSGPAAQYAHDEPIHWANGSCMILRKTMIQDIGLLDKNFVFLGSDSDYCFTARARGWQVWRIGAARGLHEHGQSGATENPEIQLLKINDMLYFGRKWLTGELYKQLAYQPNKYSVEDIDSFVNQLQRAKERLTAV